MEEELPLNPIEKRKIPCPSYTVTVASLPDIWLQMVFKKKKKTMVVFPVPGEDIPIATMWLGKSESQLQLNLNRSSTWPPRKCGFPWLLSSLTSLTTSLHLPVMRPQSLLAALVRTRLHFGLAKSQFASDGINALRQGLVLAHHGPSMWRRARDYLRAVSLTYVRIL